jgi:hypothetical protein
MLEATKQLPPGRKTKPKRGDRRYGRSAVSNGNRLLAGVDGRNSWARRCRDVLDEHLADKGGIDNCSAPERSIIRRAATLTVELERMETDFALAGEAQPNQLELYQRVANSLRRLLEAVGLERRCRDVTLDNNQNLLARVLARVGDGATP